MDRLTERQYKLDIDRNQMKKLGFRYDHDIEDYVYKFPVYRHKEIPLIYCKLGIDDETKRVWFNVCNSDGRLYASYYNGEYGKNDIVNDIEKAIFKELNKLDIKKVK